MSVRVRPTDGRPEIWVKLSKQTTVEGVKHEVEKQLHVKKDLQRLFFSGKQLEDGYYLDSYNVNFNDIILLNVKTKLDNVETKVTSGNKESVKKEEDSEQEEKEEELEKSESLYYKIGDAVDCRDETTGAWFEAIIKYIYKKGDEIFYKILWESDNSINKDVSEARVRPRARRSIPVDELSVGQKVMINYNIDDPTKIGLWFDCTVADIAKKRGRFYLVGQLHISSDTEICIQKTVKEEIYAIEAPKLLTERTAEDERFVISDGKGRPVAPNCEECEDDPNKECRSCGCNICAGKENPDTLLMCDECDDMFHLKCLTPPLLEVPQETYWYCPECKIDENEIVKVGDKLKGRKRKLVYDKERNWGGGMANVRRREICYIVPPHHRGPIPGVDVGMSWMFRIQVSEAGVHRPPVGGIHGRAVDCAYSIVLSGGYEGDYDHGDEFLYSGSGGRDLSGNKRTNKVQSKDQELTGMNLALAKNCNAPVNDEEGAEASESNWRKGIPVRVVRNYKLGKHSKYAPEEGNRYDGIYKVIKYRPIKSRSGFRIWQYVLRRDDPTPAPWTKEGKARIEFLGLKMLYPDGYSDEMKTINKTGVKKRLNSDEEDNVDIKKFKTRGKKRTKKPLDSDEEDNVDIKKFKTGAKKRAKKSLDNDEEDNVDTKKSKTGTKKRFDSDKEDSDEVDIKKSKKIKHTFDLDNELKTRIEKDFINKKLWTECLATLSDGKPAFVECVKTRFSCVCCLGILYRPVTTPCGHNICLKCLQQTLASEIDFCPTCRYKLKDTIDLTVNETLSSALLLIYPGYKGEQ